MKIEISKGSNENWFLRVDGKLACGFLNKEDAEYHKERYYFVYSIIGKTELLEYYKYLTISSLQLIALIRKSKLNKEGLVKLLKIELAERGKVLYVLNKNSNNLL